MSDGNEFHSSDAVNHRLINITAPSLLKLLITPFGILPFSSTSFWYQFLHFRLTYSFTYHCFLFCFTM